jgi:2-phosphosulfolactate phosphatase
MTLDVVLLPSALPADSLAEKTVVVLDVLRATTTIAAALTAGITSIRAFPDLAQARAAAESLTPRPILCGELKALRAPGFDLGNSPRQFTPEHRGRAMILATTNGTVALNAARTAGALLTAALVNATPAARAAAATGMDIVLLCSGTGGLISMEDLIGAGAVCDALLRLGNFELAGDTPRIAQKLFLASRENLPAVLHESVAGGHIIAVGLELDIDYAARLDSLDVVGAVEGRDMLITAMSQRGETSPSPGTPGEGWGEGAFAEKPSP